MSPIERTWCGRLLTGGFVVFMIGAVFWRSGFQAPEAADALRSMAEHRVAWLWIHSWIAAGTILAVAGLTAWAEIQRQAGERLATPVGVMLFAVGALLWLAAIGLRVTVEAWAAQEAASGAIPAIFFPLHRLAGVFYAAHMILAYGAAILLGLGVLRSKILPDRLGKAGLIGGAVFLASFVVFAGGPFGMPFLAQLYTLALGLTLLRAPIPLRLPQGVDEGRERDAV